MADATHERAARRLTEAEAGARMLRERVSDEVLTAQRDALRESKTRRDEAARVLGEARERATELKEQARHLLERARAEADDVLVARDRAADELTRLSDVITVLSAGDTDRHPTEENPSA
jgi:hypothetical protein